MVTYMEQEEIDNQGWLEQKVKSSLSEAEIKHLKQQYATPLKFIDWVVDNVLVPRGRGFIGIDVCASKDNHKAAEWIDEEKNGLVTSWKAANSGPAWCNPPFRDVFPWLMKAHTEAYKHGVLSCVLTHMDHSTEWFAAGMFKASECILINPLPSCLVFRRYSASISKGIALNFISVSVLPYFYGNSTPSTPSGGHGSTDPCPPAALDQRRYVALWLVLGRHGRSVCHQLVQLRRGPL